jgi:hypothetical protein
MVSNTDRLAPCRPPLTVTSAIREGSRQVRAAGRTMSPATSKPVVRPLTWVQDPCTQFGMSVRLRCLLRCSRHGHHHQARQPTICGRQSACRGDLDDKDNEHRRLPMNSWKESTADAPGPCSSRPRNHPPPPAGAAGLLTPGHWQPVEPTAVTRKVDHRRPRSKTARGARRHYRRHLDVRRAHHVTAAQPYTSRWLAMTSTITTT